MQSVRDNRFLRPYGVALIQSNVYLFFFALAAEAGTAAAGGAPLALAPPGILLLLW